MRYATRSFWLATVVCGLAFGVVAAQDRTETKKAARTVTREAVNPQSAPQAGAVDPAQAQDGEPLVPPQVISDVLPKDLVLPLSPNAVVRRSIITVGQPRQPGPVQAASSVVPTGTLVYSSTLGKSTFGPAQNTEIADDIIHTGSNGCLLDAFSFKVAADKRDNKASLQPPITVTYALNSLCPGSTFNDVTIPGTTGTVVLNPQCVSGPNNGLDCTSSLDCGVCQNDGITPCTAATQDADCGAGQLCDAGVCDDVVHEIVVEIPAGTDIPIPNTVYLSLEFDQSNVAAVVGAPPTLGFSQDVIDTPNFKCASSIGGFPSGAYGSFHSQLWVRGACARSFVSYRDSNQNQARFSPGTGILFADEIKLGAIPCNMVAYEVSLKGSGRRGAGSVQSELHTVLDDAQPNDIGLIPGSRVTTFVLGSSKATVKRVEFDPPVPINQDLFAVFTTSNGRVGPIATCAQASPGTTPNTYAQHDGIEWVKTLVLPECFSAFDVTIYCEGEPIPGACCDMIITENATCIGGPKDTQACQFSVDCACGPDDPLPCKDGRCVGEAVCREVPEMNCAFPELWAPTGRCGPVCHGGGSREGEHCLTDADCPGTNAVCGGNFCTGGANDGLACDPINFGDAQCQPNGVCGGSFCVGGINDGKACAQQSDCVGGECANQNFRNNISCGQAACCHFDPNLNGPGAGGDTCDSLTERECFLFEPTDMGRQFQRAQRCGSQGQRCPKGACLERDNSCTIGVEQVCVLGNVGAPCTGFRQCGTSDPAACPLPDVRGCKDPLCCTDVCNLIPSCCSSSWNADCALTAQQVCANNQPPNDECFDALDDTKGALLINAEAGFIGDAATVRATTDPSDPGFCCNIDNPGGQGEGTLWYKFIAPPLPEDPTSPTVPMRLRTCNSTSRQIDIDGDGDTETFFSNDSMIQIFKAPNPDQGICSDLGSCSVSLNNCADGSECLPDEGAICESLVPVTCNDDFNCPAAAGTTQPMNSSLCLDLDVGALYYVMVSGKPTKACVGGDNDRMPCTVNADCPGPGSGGTCTAFTNGVFPLDIRVEPTRFCGGRTPPANDLCEDAERLCGAGEIVDPCPLQMDVAFDLANGGPPNLPATFDCPGPSLCLVEVPNDIWYDWQAPATGRLEIKTCGADLGSTPLSQVAVYGPSDMPVDCPVRFDNELACDDTGAGQVGCTNGSFLQVNVTKGQWYKFRVGAVLNSTRPTAGTLQLDLDPCPDGMVLLPTLVDAREAHSPTDPATSEEVSSFFVEGPAQVADPANPGGLLTLGVNNFACWEELPCESSQGSNTEPIEINDIFDQGPGSILERKFLVQLNRPITTGAVTRFTFRHGDGTTSVGLLTTHPLNVDGGPQANASDIVLLEDFLMGVSSPVCSAPPDDCALFSEDMDRSGTFGPADLLRAIDIFSGNAQFPPLLVDKPPCGDCCP